jgi:hypothetical protein
LHASDGDVRQLFLLVDGSSRHGADRAFCTIHPLEQIGLPNLHASMARLFRRQRAIEGRGKVEVFFKRVAGVVDVDVFLFAAIGFAKPHRFRPIKFWHSQT